MRELENIKSILVAQTETIDFGQLSDDLFKNLKEIEEINNSNNIALQPTANKLRSDSLSTVHTYQNTAVDALIALRERISAFDSTVKELKEEAEKVTLFLVNALQMLGEGQNIKTEKGTVSIKESDNYNVSDMKALVDDLVARELGKWTVQPISQIELVQNVTQGVLSLFTRALSKPEVKKLKTELGGTQEALASLGIATYIKYGINLRGNKTG